DRDPASLHKYLFTGADPINFGDPTGNAFTLLENQTAILVMGILISATLVAPALQKSKAGAGIISGFSWLMTTAADDVAAAGEWAYASGAAIYSTIVANTKKVGEAIEEAWEKAVEWANRAGKALADFAKIPKFPIIRSTMPAIFDFDVSALALNP